MELKVWVEGLPRVVCGVHEQTTCRDVVRALAQALGRPGRYSLVQRWRDSQRTVAPAVPLLADLRRWGDYATDVELVLVLGDTVDAPALSGDKVPRGTGVSAPRLPDQTRQRTVGSVAKGYVDSASPERGSDIHRGRLLRRDNDDNEVLSHNAAIMRAASDRLNGGVAYVNNTSTAQYPAADTARGIRHYPHSNQQQQQQQRHARTSSASRAVTSALPDAGHRRDANAASLPRHSNSHRQQRSEPVATVIADSSSSGVVRLLNSRPIVAASNVGLRGTQPQSDTALRDDIMKQLARQADVLKQNLATMMSLDRDIAEVEETMRREERELAFAEGTARRLEERMEPELEELELVSWEGKLELEEQQRARAQAHLADTRSLVIRLDDELAVTRDQSHRLARQVADAREKMHASGDDSDSVDKKTRARVYALNGALATARIEHEAQSDILDTVNDELRRVEQALAECTEHLHTLETSTSDSLGQRILSDPTDKSSEDSGCLSRSSSSRSASSPSRRIIDQPAQLQDLAPSAAHPQGMWV